MKLFLKIFSDILSNIAFAFSEESTSTLNWNKGKNLWKCDYCSFKSNTFLDFIQLGAKHICPYGCERMIPDKYHGCTELLRDFPNYVFD